MTCTFRECPLSGKYAQNKGCFNENFTYLLYNMVLISKNSAISIISADTREWFIFGNLRDDLIYSKNFNLRTWASLSQTEK